MVAVKIPSSKDGLEDLRSDGEYLKAAVIGAGNAMEKLAGTRLAGDGAYTLVHVTLLHDTRVAAMDAVKGAIMGVTTFLRSDSALELAAAQARSILAILETTTNVVSRIARILL